MAKEVKMVCECDTEVPCCVALETKPIDEDRAVEAARAFSALGDPHRVAIIHLIAATGQPVCVVDVERHLPLAQSTVSYHLKTLLDAGVITRERRGRWSYYDLVDGRIAFLVDTLTAYRPAAAAA